jgi:hypothetical protein
MQGQGCTNFWWLRSPGNNDNNAANVNNNNGNVNPNGNNVNNNDAARPALPYRPMRVESSAHLCIRAKESSSFSSEMTEEHMLSEAMDAHAFIVRSDLL